MLIRLMYGIIYGRVLLNFLGNNEFHRMLFYTTLKSLLIIPQRKLPRGSETLPWPGWGWRGRRLQPGSLKGCGGRVRCAEAWGQLHSGLACLFSLALGWISGGRQACCLGKHEVLPYTKRCSVTLFYSYVVLK